MAPRLHSAALVVLVVVVTVCSMHVDHVAASKKEKCNGRNGLRKCPSYPNAITTCEDGYCSATCQPGFANCNGDMTGDGCETAASQCGACGSACPSYPNAITTCEDGQCGNLLCNTGYTDCNGKLEDGCEVDTYRDPLQCGACGSACPSYPNATTKCEDGQCGNLLCNTGFTDCNGKLEDGCEVDTYRDPLQCGACGSACPSYPNAIPTCEDGQCSATCQPGYANCNGDMTRDGCEVKTSVDVENCGVCGNVCPVYWGTVQYCSSGACNYRCQERHTQCYPNNIDNRGCIDLSDNDKNCGQCGIECPAGQWCFESVCSWPE